MTIEDDAQGWWDELVANLAAAGYEVNPAGTADRLARCQQVSIEWADKWTTATERADAAEEQLAELIDRTTGDPTSIYHECEQLRAECDALRANRDVWMAQTGLERKMRNEAESRLAALLDAIGDPNLLRLDAEKLYDATLHRDAGLNPQARVWCRIADAAAAARGEGTDG